MPFDRQQSSVSLWRGGGKALVHPERGVMYAQSRYTRLDVSLQHQVNSFLA